MREGDQKNIPQPAGTFPNFVPKFIRFSAINIQLICKLIKIYYINVQVLLQIAFILNFNKIILKIMKSKRKNLQKPLIFYIQDSLLVKLNKSTSTASTTPYYYHHCCYYSKLSLLLAVFDRYNKTSSLYYNPLTATTESLPLG